MKWKMFLGILLLLAVTVAAGCSLTGSPDRKSAGDNKAPQTEGQQKNNSDVPPVNPQPTKDKVEVTLYFGDDQAMYLKPEKRIVEKGGSPMAELLIQELIRGPELKGYNKTIPPEARLISLEVANGVAFVNFSEEIKTKHWGGSAGETMTVQSVIHTLAQLPEIKKVQFLIEGEKEESIWGHGYTAEPISPAQEIITK